MKICRENLGVPVLERSLDRTDVYRADEVILAGTGAEIASVVEVDGRIIGTGKAGPLAGRIQEIYHKLVQGEWPDNSNFVTKIAP